MTRLWREGLQIEVQRAAADGPPARFRIDGHTLEIDRIWQHWLVQGDWWSEQGEVDQEFFACTTKDPPILLVIVQDNLRAGKWFIQKIYD